MRSILCVAAAAWLLVTAAGQTRPGASSGSPPTSAKSKAQKSSTPKKKTSGKSKRPARGGGQRRPTPERYKEIETALAARGYLSEPPTGQWTAASVEALRKFQAANRLPATGKLDSLSLIRLGLGQQQP